MPDSLPGPARPPLRTALVLTAFGALTGSLLEMAVRLFSIRFAPWPRAALYLNPQAVWLGPLANALLLVIPVAAALALARWIGAARALRLVAWMCFTMAAFVPLLLVPRIHNLALLMLAAGIGSAATRWWMGDARRARIVSRATAVLACCCLLLAAGWNVRLAVLDRRAARAWQPITGTRSVLLVIFDTVRAANLGAYGHRRATSPVMDSLARDGVRFAAALSTAPWTLPSHVSMLTGRWDHEQSTSWIEGRSGRYPIIPQRLAPLGYASAGFSANLEYVSRRFRLHLGFDHFQDHIVSPWAAVDASAAARFLRGHLPERWALRIPGRKTAAVVNEEFLRWQEGLHGRPFFAMLNYYDAHAPYAPPAPFDMRFLDGEPPSRNVLPGPPFDAAGLAQLEAAYDGGIAYADAELGKLLAELADRGALDSTIVIATSDHGEEFGEHGMIGHGHGLNYGALHVPLIFAGAGVPAGVVVDQPVSLLDLGATILELARGHTDSAVPGASLAALWRADTTAAPSPAMSEVDWAPHIPADVPLGRGDMASLVDGPFHLIRRGDGVLFLYDRLADPAEQRDLAGDPRYQARRDALAAALAAARRLGVPRPRTHR